MSIYFGKDVTDVLARASALMEALLTIGFDAHLDPEIVTVRALLEVAQSRLVQIQGAREDTYRAELMRIMSCERIKRLNRH
jgi:ribosomal protein S12 methylthiotransferase accessory factor